MFKAMGCGIEDEGDEGCVSSLIKIGVAESGVKGATGSGIKEVEVGLWEGNSMVTGAAVLDDGPLNPLWPEGENLSVTLELH